MLDKLFCVGGACGSVSFLFLIIASYTNGWIISSYLQIHTGLLSTCYRGYCVSVPISTAFYGIVTILSLAWISLLVCSCLTWKGIFQEDLKSVKIGAILSLVAGSLTFLGLIIFHAVATNTSLVGFSYFLAWFAAILSMFGGSYNIHKWKSQPAQ